MNTKTLLLSLCFSIYCLQSFCQQKDDFNRIESIKNRLETISYEIPQLQNKVSFSVSGISLYEFIRALGVNNKINLNVDPSMSNLITVNFSNVTIHDLIIYLCDHYNLEILTNGNIISVVKYIEPQLEVAPPDPKIPNISFDNQNRTLSYDLQSDTLREVLKKITELSGVNIISPQKIQKQLISGYVKDMLTDKAIKELAYINNLAFRIKDSGTCYIEELSAKPIDQENANSAIPNGLKLITNKRDSIISISANSVPIKDILSSVAQQLNINYFLFSDVKGTSNLKAERIDLTTFFKYLFNGTDITFKENNGIYLIGDRKIEEIRSAEVYSFQYRTITKVIDQIPTSLKKDLELIPLADLNGLIIAGSPPAVKELKDFLRQIDKIVPVINIELTILDIRKSQALATGISAGIDPTKVNSTYSSVYPSVDVTLGANTINSIINGINGTGIVNLGKVTTGFYVSLKASEDNGNLKIRSTPRLATINGNEATMTIGETRYYAEQTTNVITNTSTTTVNAKVFKELQANFSITIKPIVSGDEQITLDISVEQSTFTEQFTKDGPYGRLTRSFKSSLRVKNNDMILLGGLEEKTKSDAGSGLPFLSRIPILKWLVSSRSSSDKKTKLAILIHPTVFY